MSDRFASSGQSTPSQTAPTNVGLVALSDFRKRRAEAQDPSSTATLTPGTTTPVDSDANDDVEVTEPVKKKPKKKKQKKLLSFDNDEGEEQSGNEEDQTKAKVKANATVGLVPKSMTKSALRKEATEREALRKEFLSIQEAVKGTEIAIPFVFYDGSDIPGGTVRVKKGDYVWVFLDKSRKIGAELGVGEKTQAVRKWARVGVDDLLIVRSGLIIPHHYDFYYFLINQSLGPNGQRIFDYAADKASAPPPSDKPTGGLMTAAESKAAAKAALPDINTLEGADDDPSVTKIVDRRWYESNQHIYPASTWQMFEAEKDYAAEVRRDAGGNAFFFSR